MLLRGGLSPFFRVRVEFRGRVKYKDRVFERVESSSAKF